MAKRQLPSPEVLRQLLRYEPDTGKLFWKERPEGPAAWNGRFAGKEAISSPDGFGYLHGRVDYIPVRAHRVIFAMVYGYWPEAQVDHINGDRSDNRIENLRGATWSENQRNKGTQSNNKSGAKGVYWNAQRRKWHAQIKVNGDTLYLGRFARLEDARMAYQQAAKDYHGDFARFG